MLNAYRAARAVAIDSCRASRTRQSGEQDEAALLISSPHWPNRATLTNRTCPDTATLPAGVHLDGSADTNTYLTWQVHANGPDGLVTLFVDAFSGVMRFKQSHIMEDLDIETGNHDTSISCWILTTSDDQWFDEDDVVSGAHPDAEGYSCKYGMRKPCLRKHGLRIPYA